MYYVYILRNLKDFGYYIGSTDRELMLKKNYQARKELLLKLNFDVK